MDASSDDDLFLHAVDHVVLEALARIGDDPEARFRFLLQNLAIAQQVAAEGTARLERGLQ